MGFVLKKNRKFRVKIFRLIKYLTQNTKKFINHAVVERMKSSIEKYFLDFNFLLKIKSEFREEIFNEV